MRRLVLLDVRANQRTGIDRFGTGLVRALDGAVGADAPLPEGVRFVVLAEPGQRPRLPHLGTLPIRYAPAADAFVRRSAWVQEQVAQLRPALYVTTHYTVDRALAVPFVHTVHDLHRLQFPQYAYTPESVARHYGPGEWEVIERELRALREWDDGQGPTFVRYFRALNRYLAGRARAVATVSRTTRAHLMDLLGVASARVHLLPAGVDPGFRPQPADRVEQMLRQHGIEGPYWLYVGLVGPTKRFQWLLETPLRRPALDGGRLVVVGGHAQRRAEVAHLLGRHNAPVDVRLLDFVTDAELACLYTGATALLVPSLSEGFHLPTAEALACGTEVIAADIPALRETAGSFAHYFPPEDDRALLALCAAASAGALPSLSGSYRAPRWSTTALQLARVVAAVLD